MKLFTLIILFTSVAFANDPLAEIKARNDLLQGAVTKKQIIAAQLDIVYLLKLANSYDLMCEGMVELGYLEPTYKNTIYIGVSGDHYTGGAK